jgi:hypothetical protein
MTVKELTPAQVAPLSDIVAVANTPAYLFKHFLADPTVQALARQYSAADLIDHARQIASTTPVTFAKAAEFYAALVAATQRSVKEFPSQVDYGVLGNIRWAQQILDMRRIAHTTNTSSFIASPSITHALTAMSSASPLRVQTTEQSARNIIVDVSKGRR